QARGGDGAVGYVAYQCSVEEQLEMLALHDKAEQARAACQGLDRQPSTDAFVLAPDGGGEVALVPRQLGQIHVAAARRSVARHQPRRLTSRRAQSDTGLDDDI